jgi:hypothetical protein
LILQNYIRKTKIEQSTKNKQPTFCPLEQIV